MTIHAKHLEWLAARGIEPGLAELLGLDTRPRDGKNWLVLPYWEDGKPLNHKWRLTSVKDHRMDTGAPLILYNADDLNGAETVTITEGEFDLLAVKTAMGMEWPCVSVPNGAPSDMTENPWEADRYRWHQHHLAKLDRVKSFILAVDNDPAGRWLASDLACLLGPERCKFIIYPDDCKDLNEVLVAHGPEVVERILNEAKHYPVKGLYRFSDYPPKPDLQVVESRLPGVKGRWPLVMSTFSVITGWSGIGKTTLLAWIIADYLKQGITIAIGSFETDVEILKKLLRACLMEKPFWDGAVHREGEFDEMIERQVLLIAQHCGTEEAEMDLGYLLDCARVAVVRDGAKLVIVDPWNEIEHKRRRNEQETDYIGRAIRDCKRFIRRYNVAMWMVAHPTKPPLDASKPPNLYAISGSANWNNKADYGVIVHRADKKVPVTDLIVDKVRVGLPGEEGWSKLGYDKHGSRFLLED